MNLNPEDEIMKWQPPLALLIRLSMSLSFISITSIFGMNDSTILHPVKAGISPVIDGNLNDPIWQTSPILGENFITYWPSNGDTLPQKNQVWMAYDADNLYFAFYCHDTNPQGIKTSVCHRDRIWDDDWITPPDVSRPRLIFPSETFVRNLIASS